jgi:hypothetical protein
MTITANTTVTDPIGLSASDSLVIDEGIAGGITTVRRSLVDTRIIWGPVIDQAGVVGPVPQHDGEARVLSQFFKLQWNVRILGGSFYKVPLLAGDIEFRLWKVNGTGIGVTGTQISSVTLAGLVVDQGGAYDFTFPTPIAGLAGETYAITYYTASGEFAGSSWVWHAQDWINPPFEVPQYSETTQGRWNGNAWMNATNTGHDFPTQHTASNYYIDVEVEWDVNTPRYKSGTDYYNQWSNGPVFA